MMHTRLLYPQMLPNSTLCLCGAFPSLVRRKHFKAKKKWAYYPDRGDPSFLALQHFDFFYKPLFQKRWPSIRLGLLSDPKYIAVINNFGTPSKATEKLQVLGGFDLLKIVADERRNLENRLQFPVLGSKRVGQISANDNEDLVPPFSESSSYSPPAEDLSMSSSAMFEFVPPSQRHLETEDYLPKTVASGRQENYEMDYWMAQYKTTAGDAAVSVADGERLEIPSEMSAICFARGDISTFPQADILSGVAGHYLMDGASILPVLALGLKPGDAVLDLCAAPGGKSVAILQSMFPSTLTCNDDDPKRIRRLVDTLDLYIPRESSMRKRISVTQFDASQNRWMNSGEMFDKVIVDAPCSTDRQSVQGTEKVTLFKPSRAAERMNLPIKQTGLLRTALSVVKEGGAVVYSTCTLSPLQNDQVVVAAIMGAEANSSKRYQVDRMESFVGDLKRTHMFRFYEGKPSDNRPQLSVNNYGRLIVPFTPSNFGPTYFCRIVRTE